MGKGGEGLGHPPMQSYQTHPNKTMGKTEVGGVEPVTRAKIQVTRIKSFTLAQASAIVEQVGGTSECKELERQIPFVSRQSCQ
jgi:hypothetical protein